MIDRDEPSIYENIFPCATQGKSIDGRPVILRLEPMRALSVRQPWAGLVVAGIKDIENRSRRTRHRGPLLIHASQRRARRTLAEIALEYGVAISDELAELCARSGGIIGIADVIDCVPTSPSRWFDGPIDSRGGRNWGYVLRDARALPFRPTLGRLGIFNVPEIATQIATGLPMKGQDVSGSDAGELLEMVNEIGLVGTGAE